MKRVTINDIAKHCGTSKATVSYVINGRQNKVSAEMIQKVEQAIEELGYVPSLSAKSLAGKGSNLIGVIIPQMDVTQKMIFDNPFYSEFLSGIEYSLRKSGYSVVLSVVNRENCFEDMMMKWNLDGAVVFGIDNDSRIKTLGKSKVPILLIDSYITDKKYYRMNLPDEKAGYNAAKVLLEEGRQKIAIVTGNAKKSMLLTKRLNGYKEALEEYGIPYSEDLVYQGDITYEYGLEAAKDIISRPEITGIVATADILAYGIINQLQICGKKIPEEYSIIGFDDTYQSRIMHPKVSTVGQNISKRGEKAGEIILNIIRGEQQDKEIIMDCQIIQRGTTLNKK